MRTIILVNMAAWRCGSSLLTGLLNKMGAEIGKCSTPPNVHNVMGYFENDKLLAFQRKYYLPHMDLYDKRKTCKEMFDIAKEHQAEFDDILDEETGNSDFFVVKSMMSALVPFVLNNTKYNHKILWMRRDTFAQARSLSNLADIKNWVNPKIYNAVVDCHKWTVDFLRESKAPYMEIWFSKLFDNAAHEANKIVNYVGMDPLKIKEGLSFIHPEISKSR